MRFEIDARKLVEEWNRRYRPGTPVHYRTEGRTVDALTRTKARVVDGLAVVQVEGRSGYVYLELVDPIESKRTSSCI